MIVLTETDVEVLLPAKLAVHISLLRQLGVLGHARSLHLILFVGVEPALHGQYLALSIVEVFIEVLLQ